MIKPLRKLESEEHGQILVLLAISLVVILVGASLAVDGGMVYSERRFAQNAADAASMSGASSIGNFMLKNGVDYRNLKCTDFIKANGDFYGIDEAKTRASSNNFTDLVYQGAEINGTFHPKNSGDADANHGIIVACEDRGIQNDIHVDFKVKITTETSTAFLHLIFPDNLKSTVEAVTRVYPRHDITYGTALLSDKNQEDCVPSDNCGIVFTGTSGTVITGGGVRSDSGIDAGGSTSVTVNDGSVSAHGTITGTSNITAASVTGGVPGYNEDITLTPPPCNGTNYGAVSVGNGDNTTISPGNFTKITVNGGKLTLNPGIYCIDSNQGISMSGGLITGDRVAFYMKNGAVTINVTGDPTKNKVFLTSPDASTLPAEPFGGWLIIMATTNTNAIDITGSGYSYYAGAIFNPDGVVKVAGSADTYTPVGGIQPYSTQIIAKSITIAGKATVNINFDASKVPNVPSLISLLK